MLLRGWHLSSISNVERRFGARNVSTPVCSVLEGARDLCPWLCVHVGPRPSEQRSEVTSPLLAQRRFDPDGAREDARSAAPHAIEVTKTLAPLESNI